MKLDPNDLRNLATKAIKNTDPDEYVEEIYGVIQKPIRKYLKELINEQGLPDHMEGWDFDDIELRLCHLDKNSYVPSVRSDYWDAPASTWGIDFNDPLDALTTGLTDAYANQFAAELTDEDDE